jgi:hypothetical protein
VQTHGADAVVGGVCDVEHAAIRGDSHPAREVKLGVDEGLRPCSHLIA